MIEYLGAMIGGGIGIFLFFVLPSLLEGRRIRKEGKELTEEDKTGSIFMMLISTTLVWLVCVPILGEFGIFMFCLWPFGFLLVWKFIDERGQNLVVKSKEE